MNSQVTKQPTGAQRAGFTLVEVLLVLALSAVVMLLVGGAVRFQLRMTDSGDRRVRQAQLARMILRQLSNDLRAATFADPNASGGSGSSGGGAGSATGSDSGTGSTGSGSTGSGSATATGSSTATSADSGTQTDLTNQTAPGLYGDMYQLRLEVTRPLDTSEWFQMLESDEDPVFEQEVVPQPYGSLQSVTYSLASNMNLGLESMIANLPMASSDVADANMQILNSGGGLVRQAVDHPVVALALTNGGTETLDPYSYLVAPEVVDLTFRYFDGTEWVTEWDTYALGGLPTAVEITLVLAPISSGDLSTTDVTVVTDPESIYTQIVHLPSALPTDETEAQL